MKHVAIAVLALTAPGLAGCGTTCGMIFALGEPIEKLDHTPVYIGAQLDAKVMTSIVAGEGLDFHPVIQAFLLPFVFADFLLSIILDTLFLPTTLILELARPHDWPDEAGKAP